MSTMTCDEAVQEFDHTAEEMRRHPVTAEELGRTNAEIREKLLESDDVLAVRIGRDGAVSVRTTKTRGDGGKTPLWQFRGWADQYRIMSDEQWAAL